MQTLNNQLIEISKQTSRFEERRDYVSLSNIIKPVDELIHDYLNGYTANEDALLKCRMGYYMEAGLMERLLKIEGVEPGKEIVVPGCNGIVKGHPDFMYNGMPGDCKSFALDAYLPDPNRLAKRIYWQMNAYMLFSNTYSSVVVCESRESGKIRTIEVRINDNVCNAILEKLKVVFYTLNSHQKAV